MQSSACQLEAAEPEKINVRKQQVRKHLPIKEVPEYELLNEDDDSHERDGRSWVHEQEHLHHSQVRTRPDNCTHAANVRAGGTDQEEE